MNEVPVSTHLTVDQDPRVSAASYYAGASAAGAAGLVGEHLQTDAQAAVNFDQALSKAAGVSGDAIPHTYGNDLGGHVTELLARMPDMNHLMVAAGVMALYAAANVANRLSDRNQAPNQSRGMRLLRKVGHVAVASVLAYGAYKLADHMTPLEMGATTVATVGMGGVVIANAQIGASRRRSHRRRDTQSY